MPESMTAQQFQEVEGVEDWRILSFGAGAHFRTGTFAKGIELVAAIGELARTSGRHPDVDLRPSGVTVRLMTEGISATRASYVELARAISAAARALDVPADPTAVQDLNITIDALDIPRVRDFWRGVTGYLEWGEADLIDPHWRGPSFWFQPLDAARPQRNCVHLDVFVPHELAEARVAAGLAAGGRMVSDEHAPAWWVLADPEGNEVCIATCMGRD